MPGDGPFELQDLLQEGLNARDISQLIKRGWLERLGKNVYARQGKPLSAGACVAMLERRMRGLYIGGQTALRIHLEERNALSGHRIDLWSHSSMRLPPWFTQRFPAPYRTMDAARIGIAGNLGLDRSASSGAMVSVPERALLELLVEVGQQIAIEDAAEFVRRLRLISHAFLRHLLMECGNAKIIRLAHLLCSHAGHDCSQVTEEVLLQMTGTISTMKH